MDKPFSVSEALEYPQMILPGTSRQIITEALSAVSSAPHMATSKVVNDLSDAGYRIVHGQETTEILRGLIALVEVDHDSQMNPTLLRAKAFCDLLSD